jgi:hypothetical protein
MWVVRQGDDLFVRPVKGRDGWYRGAQTCNPGHIGCGGVEKDVTFEDAHADPALRHSQARSSSSLMLCCTSSLKRRSRRATRSRRTSGAWHWALTR